MSAIIFAILSYLLLYKYVALFVVSYLAVLFIPLPSNTSLFAAAAFASQGYLNIYIVIIVALAANVLGDLTAFFVSRIYGKDFLIKIGLRKVLASKEYENLEVFIIKHSRVTIFITRFFGGLGTLVSILTGLSENISFKKFFLYGFAGECVYVMSFVLPGYFLGSAWQEFTPSIELVSLIALFLFVLFVISKIHNHHKKVDSI